MAESELDITPDKGGHKGMQVTVFQDTEWNQINENPSNLTKEGIEEKIKIWKGCANRHVVLKYETMLNKCRVIAPSGKTEDGRLIFSRDKKGNPKWVSVIKSKVPSLTEKKVK